MGFFQQASLFLVQVVFGILVLIIMLRFLMQVVRADFRNPLSQGIYRLTNPMLVPFRKIIPGAGGVDLPAIVLMMLLQYAMLTLVNVIYGIKLELLRNFIEVPFSLFNLLINVYLFSILIMVIVSWIQPQGSYNPVIALINQIIHPILAPFRKRIPPAGGFDLSPMVAMIALVLVKMAIPFMYRALVTAIGLTAGSFDIGWPR